MMNLCLTVKSKEKTETKLEIKEEYFIRNGGILLEKQLALSQGRDVGSGQLKILSVNDIKNATNCFDPDLIVANVFGTLYRGILDNRIVAVRVPFDLPPTHELIDALLTEASVGGVMSHCNMVKLYGCCLETSVPVLFYDFLANGSLADHLHGGGSEELRWCHRLRVAADVSYALSYMHNALSKPLVHRAVNSAIVLLDDSFHAKLSSFGNSVLITPRESTQRWPVRGVPGYVDPEYVETRELTDKCDVYSFGVFMLELLTGRDPSQMAHYGTDLVDVFLSEVGGNRMMDKEMLDQGNGDEIEKFAELALKCVAKKGIERPTMIEVVKELWLIQHRENI